MRNLIAAIRSALGSMMTTIARGFRAVSKATAKGLIATWEAVEDVVYAAPSAVWGAMTETAEAFHDFTKGAVGLGWRATKSIGRGIAFAGDEIAKLPGQVLSLPGKILGKVFSGGEAASPTQAVAEAEARAVQQETRADDAVDLREQLAAFRRVAAAMARGEVIPQSAKGRLHHKILSYLHALDGSELEILARSRTTELKRLFEIGAAPDGVRNTQEVAEYIRASRERDIEVSGAAAGVAANARRDELKVAFRGGARPQPLDEIIAEDGADINTDMRQFRAA